MHGSLALYRSSLFVGNHEKTARVRVFDLDGRERAEGFRFKDARSGRASVAGLAVDEDRRIWVADTPNSRVRSFTIFGREEGGIGAPLDAPLDEPPFADRRAFVRAPTDVAVDGHGEEGRIVVACAGTRRHAVQIFDVTAGFVHSVRPLGDPHGTFRDVHGVALAGRFLYVAESGGGRVQVFRDGAFHFAFSVPCHDGRFEPVAVAPVGDGRVVVACGRDAPSALLLVDRAGRVERVLAEAGELEEGGVARPSDVVVEPDGDDRSRRVVVIDRDGERIQVFTLEGRCFGAFAEHE